MRDALWVAQKELREMLRDRRVMIGAFVMPIFMIFMFVQLIGYLEKSLSKENKIEMTVVGRHDNPIIESLQSQGRTDVKVTDDIEGAKKSLKEGDTNLVVKFSDPNPGGQTLVEVYYDGQRPMSAIANGGLRQSVAESNSKQLKELLKTMGVTEAQAEPIKVKSEDVSEKKGLGGSSLSGLIPYLVVLWAFYGGFSIVTDLIAGEKEKGTLETLLVSPALRNQVVLGKIISLSTICFASGMSSLVGLILVQVVSKGKTFEGGFNLSPVSIASFLIVLIPLVLLYSSLLIAVSSLAKSVRESQTYLTLVSFLVMTPAIFSQFVSITGDDKAGWVQWTPVLNASVALGKSLKNQTDWMLVAKCVALPLLLASIFVFMAVRTFNREEILNRT